MKWFLKELILLIIGGFSYVGIEMAYRGHSHWTMFFVGGLCFVIVGLINNVFSWKTPVELQLTIGCVLITLIEFISGLIINVQLGWNVWDYSTLPLNICGQVSLLFSFFWFLLSFAIIVIDDLLRWKLFKEEKPRYYSCLLNKTYYL